MMVALMDTMDKSRLISEYAKSLCNQDEAASSLLSAAWVEALHEELETAASLLGEELRVATALAVANGYTGREICSAPGVESQYVTVNHRRAIYVPSLMVSARPVAAYFVDMARDVKSAMAKAKES